MDAPFSDSGVDLVTIVRRAQAGSDDAAEEFVARFGPVLRAYLVPGLSGPLHRLLDADDLLQATLATILCSHFDDAILATPAGLWAYLRRIARNKLSNAR